MRQYHGRLARQLLNKVAQRIMGYEDPEKPGEMLVQPLDPNELSPSELVRFMAEAVKVERLSKGDASEIVETLGGETTVNVDIRHIVAENPVLALRARDLALDLTEEAYRVVNPDDDPDLDDLEEDVDE